MFVDLTADVTGSLSVRETSELEAKITDTLKEARREIAEVRVQFHPVDAVTEDA
jgi:divalent metal cation (Fe/Co/Zn/Cd) transporter